MNPINEASSRGFYRDLVYIFWQSPYYEGDQETFDFDTVSQALLEFLNNDTQYQDQVNDHDWETTAETQSEVSGTQQTEHTQGSVSGSIESWSNNTTTTSSSNDHPFTGDITPGDSSQTYSETQDGSYSEVTSGTKGSWKQNRQWKRDKVAWFFQYAQFCAEMAKRNSFERYLEAFKEQLTDHNTQLGTLIEDYNTRMSDQHAQQVRFNDMASDKDQGIYQNPNLKEDRYGHERQKVEEASFDTAMESSGKVYNVARRLKDPIDWERVKEDYGDGRYASRNTTGG